MLADCLGLWLHRTAVDLAEEERHHSQDVGELGKESRV